MELNAFSPGARGFDNRYEGVKGSPFLQPGYLPGVLRPAAPDAEEIEVALNQSLQNIKLRIKKILSALKDPDAKKVEKWLKQNGESVESEAGLIAVLSNLE